MIETTPLGALIGIAGLVLVAVLIHWLNRRFNT